jgi:hypothetical protein
VDARAGGFVPEPDWVLLFGAPLAALPPVGPETPCVLQGMIDGKWVGPLADAAAVEYASVSAGGNLVAGRGGIATTLGAITELRGAVAGARVRVAWRSEGGEAVESALDAAALARLPIVDIVRDLARWSFQAGVEVRAVALGASGELNPAPGGASDAFGEAILGGLFKELLALCPEAPEGVIARVRARRWKSVAGRGGLAAPGLPMTLTVTDGDGRVVGEGAMRLTDG